VQTKPPYPASGYGPAAAPSGAFGTHDGRGYSGHGGYVMGFGDHEPENLNQQRNRLQQRSSRNDTPTEEDDLGENDWAVSYADMVTLLMAFFVILTTVAIKSAAGRIKARHPVLMALLAACWQWLMSHAPARPAPSRHPQCALPAPLISALPRRRAGLFAPIRAPLSPPPGPQGLR